MSVVLSYDQLAKLAAQLPPDAKRRLAKRLAKEAEREERTEPKPTAESQLTAAQRKTWEGIKQGLAEMKQVRAGKMKSRPIKDLLDEL